MSGNHPSSARYQQGEWFGVVRGGTLVLLGPETPHALLDTVWELLASAPEAHEVLHEVTEAFGVSLSRIPPFGIIDAKGALRVFLRGDLELLVQHEGGQEELTGRDVTTWTERRLMHARSFSVRIGGGDTAQVSAALDTAAVMESAALNGLPVGEGVVLLSSIEVDLVGGTSKESSAPDHESKQTVVDAPVPVPAAEPVSDETMIGYPELDEHDRHDGDHHDDDHQDGDHHDGDHQFSEPAIGEPVISEPVMPEPVNPEPVNPEPISPESAIPEPAEEAAEVPAEGPAASEDRSVPGVPESTDGVVHTSTTDILVPSLENTTNYDHLWDKTVMRNIEDAAVRLDSDADDDHGHSPSGQGTSGQGTPSQGTSSQGTPVEEPRSDEPQTEQPPPLAAAPLPSSASRNPGDVPAQGESAVGQVQAAPSSGLIDSVPWLRSSPVEPATGGPLSAAGNVGSAPQVPPVWPPAMPAQPQGDDTEDADHDGQTIMKSSLPVDGAGSNKPAAEAEAPQGPSVLARVCSQGHANPPTYPQCSVCGIALSGDAMHVARPRLGRMRLSTGELIDLDRSLIIGRQPSVSRVQGGTMPRLVQVESPGGDISRSHVEVRLEGWHVMLCDLKATNGTVLIREGQAPRRLAQNEMAILLDGDIAELGDDISLRFEEIL